MDAGSGDDLSENVNYEEIISNGEVIFESSNSIIYLPNSEERSASENKYIVKVLRNPRPSSRKIVQFNKGH